MPELEDDGSPQPASPAVSETRDDRLAAGNGVNPDRSAPGMDSQSGAAAEETVDPTRAADSPAQRYFTTRSLASDRLRGATEREAGPRPKPAGYKTGQILGALELLKDRNRANEAGTLSGPRDQRDDGIPEEIPPAGDTRTADNVTPSAGRTRPSLTGPAKWEAARAAADTINSACNETGILGIGTDHKLIIATLQDKTEEERRLIGLAFKEKYGRTLEEEFADEMDADSPEYASCMGALKRKDGSSGDAARIDAALKEHKQVLFGRTNQACEQDILDTISTMNSRQIADLKEGFLSASGNRDKHPGGLEQALLDSDLSLATKRAAAIFLKGNDLRTIDDTRELVDIALQNGDLMLLEQSTRGTSTEARGRLAEDDSLSARLTEAFGKPIFNEITGETTYASTHDLEQARSYLAHGRLGLADSIRNSTSVLGDNEEAIESAIRNMPDDERQSYLRGRQFAETGKAPTGFTRGDTELFRKISSAFEAAGNQNERLRWDSMIEHPEGSLVETLSRHKGMIYDDSTDSVIADLEGMSQKEWQRLKDDPRYLLQVRLVLATFANGAELNADGTFADSELGRLSKLLTGIAGAQTYQEAITSGRRGLLEQIDDKIGIIDTDESGIYKALENVALGEAQRLKDEPARVQALQDKLKSALDGGAELETARGMVDNILAGKPARGVIEKINEHAARFDTPEDQVIRDLRQALKDDPSLLQTIQTDAAYKARLTDALRRALDASEFDTYARPILETGRLPIELQMRLNQGIFDDSEINACRDILFADEYEKERLLTDEGYRKRILGFLGDEEQEVALNVLRQGQLLPEDEIEINMLGLGTGEAEIKSALGKLQPHEREAVAARYYQKYGAAKGLDLRGAIADEMGGKDRADAMRLLERPANNARVEFNRRRAEYYEMRGLGETWVDNAWDGTADDARARLNNFAAAISQVSAAYKELPVEVQRQHSQALVDGIDLLGSSQGAVADGAADAIITIGAVAAAKFSGGVSLSLLAYTTAGAAMMRVGSHAALNSRFETLSAEGATQLVSGAADGLFSLAGGTEISKLLQLGRRAATESAERASRVLLKQTAALLEEGTEQGLKQSLARGTTGLVSEALATGTQAIDERSLLKLADSLVKRELEGEAREQAARQIASVLKTSLDDAIALESSNAIKQTLREIALNAAAGNLGATASAIPRGLLDYDPDHPERFFYIVGASTAIGTVAGGGITWLVKSAEGLLPAAPNRVASGQAADEAAHAGVAAREAFDGDNARPPRAPVPGDLPPHASVSYAPPQAEAFHLIVPGSAQPLPLSEERILLGRGDDAHVRLAGKTVSRHHAMIERTDAGPVLTNLSSKNPTFVNGKAIQGPTLLKDGDRIQLSSKGETMVFGKPAKQPPKTFELKVGESDSALDLSQDKIILGRGKNSDFRIESMAVSRQHAQIERTAEGHVLTNLSKTNRTLVNGEPIDGPYLLKQGDRIMLTSDGPALTFGEKPPSTSAAKGKPKDADTHPPADKLAGREAGRSPEPPPAAAPQRAPERRVTDPIPRAPGRLGGDQVRYGQVPQPPPPGRAKIMVNGKEVQVDPSGGLHIGREQNDLGVDALDAKISRDHGNIKWDADARSFYVEDHSANGTWIYRPGEKDPTRLHNKRAYIGPHDEVVVGDTRISLKLDGARAQAYPAALRVTDVQPYFDGKPIAMTDGEIKLGAKHFQFGNRQEDALNKLVSRDHATVRFDDETGNWILTDTTRAPQAADPSMTLVRRRGEPNGTYVVHRDGSVDVLRGDIPGKRSIVLKPGDSIRLGSPDGPEFKLVFGKGRDLGDGRIEFKRPNLDTVVRNPDGTQEVRSFFGTRRVEDSSGRIIETTDRRGIVNRFGWGTDGKLDTVTLGDGSTLSRAADSSWVRSSGDGKMEPWWKGDLDVDPVDGSLRYSDKGKPPVVTIERLDGSREIIRTNGRIDYDDVDFVAEVGYMNRLSQNSDIFPTTAEQRRFKELLNAFERRASREGVTEMQKALTFHHVRRLLEAGDGSMVEQKVRKDLAEQIMNQAANPQVVCQGRNSTCNVTTIERRIFTRDPDEAARLVADVATSGKYVTSDGVVVDLSRVPGALKPDAESSELLSKGYSSRNEDIAIDGRRSYASQIFETAAVNVRYAKKTNSAAGDVVLYQKSGLPGQESEELVLYYRDPADGLLKRQVTGDAPSLLTDELTGIHNRITGRRERDFVVMGPESYDTPGKMVYHDSFYPDGRLRVPGSAQELRELLLARRTEDFPLILQVHTGHDFFGMGPPGGAHVVNIQSIREMPPGSGKYELKLLNQWGSQHDGTVSVEDAFNLMLSPKTVNVPRTAFRPLKTRTDESKKLQRLTNLVP